MNVYKRKATNGLNLGVSADTQGIESWLPLAGTSKELFESNLLAGVSKMWRRHYGEVLF